MAVSSLSNLLQGMPRNDFRRDPIIKECEKMRNCIKSKSSSLKIAVKYGNQTQTGSAFLGETEEQQKVLFTSKHVFSSIDIDHPMLKLYCTNSEDMLVFDINFGQYDREKVFYFEDPDAVAILLDNDLIQRCQEAESLFIKLGAFFPKRQEMTIHGFPNGGVLSFSIGWITEINECKIYHTATDLPVSSGSLILGVDGEVAGIHSDNNSDLGLATNINYIIEQIRRCYHPTEECWRFGNDLISSEPARQFKDNFFIGHRINLTASLLLGELRSAREADAVELSAAGVVGLCAAPEPNCVLLADWYSGAVVRVSLETKCIEQCVARVPEEECLVAGVQLLQTPSAAARIALTLFKRVSDTPGETKWRLSVRLLAHKSNSWSVTDEAPFEYSPHIYSGVCVSRGLLLCAALKFSRRLVALKVTSDSLLKPAGEYTFDSDLNGLCAYASGGEQLVATTHADCTVRVWKHLVGEFALEECCRVTAELPLQRIIYSNAGLLASCWNTNTVHLFRVNGSRIETPVAQPQLGSARVTCFCRTQDTIVASDLNSNSLLTLGTVCLPALAD